MSRVRLDSEWTDAEGLTHAGETVDVDDARPAEPREARIMADGVPPAPPRAGAGPTVDAEDDDAIDIDDTDLGR
jgi:hypothetical protein